MKLDVLAFTVYISVVFSVPITNTSSSDLCPEDQTTFNSTTSNATLITSDIPIPNQVDPKSPLGRVLADLTPENSKAVRNVLNAIIISIENSGGSINLATLVSTGLSAMLGQNTTIFSDMLDLAVNFVNNTDIKQPQPPTNVTQLLNLLPNNAGQLINAFLPLITKPTAPSKASTVSTSSNSIGKGILGFISDLLRN